MAGPLLIGFLCGRVDPPSRPRFESEAERRGARTAWLDPHDLSWNGAGLTHHGEPLDLPHVVVPRNGAFTTDRTLGVIRSFEAAGVPSLNDARSVEIARDKASAADELATAGIPSPPTIAIAEDADLAAVVRELGLPLVLKSARGMRGEAVALVREAEEAAAIARRLGPPLVAQSFVPGSGFDVRLLVVGTSVLGAVRREHRPGDFRGNAEAGATSCAFPTDPDLEALAIAATAALGLDVAGVDVILGDEGPVVIEVNSAPGFSAFEEATGVNAAGAIVDLAIERARTRLRA